MSEYFINDTFIYYEKRENTTEYEEEMGGGDKYTSIENVGLLEKSFAGSSDLLRKLKFETIR